MIDITLKELTDVLEARYTMNVLFAKRLAGHFFKKTGVQIGDLILDPKIVHWFFELVARRLLDNDQSKPLVSKSDLPGLAVYLNNGQPLGFDDPEITAIFMEELEKRVAAFMQEVVNPVPGKDSYDDYWDWVQAIRVAAEEQKVDLVDSFDEADLIRVYDEVVRRLYSQEQYVAFNLREDQLEGMREERINAVRSDLLRMAPQAGTERLRFIETLNLYIKKEIEPRLNSHVEQIRKIRSEFVHLEAARIYGH